jgi:predicted P-loop ATPase
MTRTEWAARALKRTCDRVRTAAAGSRHRVLYGAAKDLGRYVRDGALSASAVEAGLLEAASDAGKPAPESARTIADGLSAGHQSTDEAWYPPERAELPRAFVWRGQTYQLHAPGAHRALVERATAELPVPVTAIDDETTVRITLFRGLTNTTGDVEQWTWADLVHMCREPQSDVEDVRDAVLLTAAEMPGDRRGKGAPDPVAIHALILDYDDDPLFSLEQVKQWWSGVQHVAYTSKSHMQQKNDGKKPACPRGRVILALSRPMTPMEYLRIVSWVASGRFGVVGLTEMRTLNRIYWAPVARAGYGWSSSMTGAAIDVDALLSSIDGTADRIEAALQDGAPSAGVWDELDKRNHGTDEEPEWRPVNSLRNLVTILERDPRWTGKLQICDFRRVALVNGEPVTSVDHLEVKLWVARVYGYEPGTERTLEGMAVVSHRNRVHPVREYLDALQWDGRARVRRVLADLFSCIETDDGLTESISLRWLVSAVARIFEPGCKVDPMLILQGPQGCRKSSGLKALTGAQWFSDTAIQLGSKDAYLALQGVWVYEFAELEGMNRAEANQVKNFLTSAVDKFRPPYGKVDETMPRQCVVAGTTNEQVFLHDRTGNRRSWVRRVRPGATVDVDGISRWRDQIWAESVHLYRAGEQWHLTDSEAAAHAADVQQYVHDDPWLETVDGLLASRGMVRVTDVLDALQLAPDHRNKGHEMRVTGLLGQLGAVPKGRRTVGGVRGFWWSR